MKAEIYWYLPACTWPYYIAKGGYFLQPETLTDPPVQEQNDSGCHNQPYTCYSVHIPELDPHGHNAPADSLLQ